MKTESLIVFVCMAVQIPDIIDRFPTSLLFSNTKLHDKMKKNTLLDTVYIFNVASCLMSLRTICNVNSNWMERISLPWNFILSHIYFEFTANLHACSQDLLNFDSSIKILLYRIHVWQDTATLKCTHSLWTSLTAHDYLLFTWYYAHELDENAATLADARYSTSDCQVTNLYFCTITFVEILFFLNYCCNLLPPRSMAYFGY